MFFQLCTFLGGGIQGNLGGFFAQMYEKIIQDSIFFFGLLFFLFFFKFTVLQKMGMQVVHIVDVQHIYCLKKE